ncbi:tryptophan-rich sensory protein [Parasphingopyxis sp. CP4]|uniref:TspO/MBR family protein n=1 Tax=Parasphingopyxis sp. CP4 TaxID=2724527 RepID=UPI0015A1FCAF|nr:TspO/MBR family protein [Parasphingopyxis sp. CP4]QLC21004.1 tryptophan-rich sensory protein [Parasphingopyxis sp. CP4]
MVGIATKGQLRMSFLRWALVLVPLIVLIGSLAGALSGSGDTSWYAALEKPSFQPPPYLFGIVWPILYALMAFALVNVIQARGSRWRGIAIGLFVAQLLVNLLWSPIFFGMHQVSFAFFWILLMIGLAVATTVVFARVRRVAAWLMLPYLAWISFAAVLNFEIDRLNPDAETLVVGATSTQI